MHKINTMRRTNKRKLEMENNHLNVLSGVIIIIVLDPSVLHFAECTTKKITIIFAADCADNKIRHYLEQ